MQEARVYIDVASAMTGVSLFGQRAAQLYASNTKWRFEKGGYEDSHATVTDYFKFTHILSESPVVPGFQVVESVQGHPRFEWRRHRIATSDAIYILRRTTDDDVKHIFPVY
jgi:hypothetical protein